MPIGATSSSMYTRYERVSIYVGNRRYQSKLVVRMPQLDSVHEHDIGYLRGKGDPSGALLLLEESLPNRDAAHMQAGPHKNITAIQLILLIAQCT